MKFKFLEETSAEVVHQFDDEADEIADSSEQQFKKDEIIDVDVVDENEGFYHLQFGDGSVMFMAKGAIVPLT